MSKSEHPIRRKPKPSSKIAGLPPKIRIRPTVISRNPRKPRKPKK